VAGGERTDGLACRLIGAILARPANRDLQHLAATVTPDNAASWRLFAHVARLLGAPLSRRAGFERERHLGGTQADEILVAIGPFGALAPATAIRSLASHAA
jgi:L-2,4-diaminobutyric acid acetyltransferase